jgi:hypothetical protein
MPTKAKSGLSKKLRLSGRRIYGKAKQRARAEVIGFPFALAGDSDDTGTPNFFFTLLSPNVLVTTIVGVHVPLGDGDWEDLQNSNSMDIDTVLGGNNTISLSHAGRELAEILEKEM